MGTVRIKRIYDPPSRVDGYRVLVDRLWPRGISKESSRVGAWKKEIAPSSALRAWFAHDPKKWRQFRIRYRAELERNEAREEMRTAVRDHAVVTLVYAARDTEHNNAVVLKEFLSEK